MTPERAKICERLNGWRTAFPNSFSLSLHQTASPAFPNLLPEGAVFPQAGEGVHLYLSAVTWNGDMGYDIRILADLEFTEKTSF
jgi:hypothetical protein